MDRPYSCPCSYTYEQIREKIPRSTAYSSTPVTVNQINPLIEKVITKCGGSIEYLGGRSVIALLSSERIAVKMSFKAGGSHLSHERKIFKLLETKPSSHIVQCFLCRPGIIFMPFISFWTLEDRMAQGKPSRPVLSWILQLFSAAAALEAIGYAHGDINPRNILVDDQDALKLVDFDHAIPIGGDVDVGYEPYVRAHYMDEGGGGTYGIAGRETEQFALGSIVWYITRGYELYHDLDGPTRVNRLCDRQFPDLRCDDPIDNIIYNCWFIKFETMTNLLQEVQTLAAKHGISDDTQSISGTEYLAKKELCNRCYTLLLEDDTAESTESGVFSSKNVRNGTR